MYVYISIYMCISVIAPYVFILFGHCCKLHKNIYSGVHYIMSGCYNIMFPMTTFKTTSILSNVLRIYYLLVQLIPGIYHLLLSTHLLRIHASSLLRGVRPLLLLAMTCNDISIFQGILTLCLEVGEAAIMKRTYYVAT